MLEKAKKEKKKLTMNHQNTQVKNIHFSVLTELLTKNNEESNKM